MTHDELLVRLDDYGFGVPPLAALRAVVELHTADFGTPNEDTVCDYCKVLYPCPTIQKIEKELG